LEHVDWNLCKKYLNRIETIYLGGLKELLKLHQQNDAFGTPRQFRICNDLAISGTTVRYVAVALELSNFFSVTQSTRVVEIGVGYGGQAAVINRQYGITDYAMFDLKPVLELTSLYLEGIQSNLIPQFFEIQEEIPQSWDLVISNYAFSELPAPLQMLYIHRVLKKSRNGFLLMNSGKTDQTGRSAGKMSLEQILNEIPNAKVSAEIPQSGPDNYLISW
jgi:hypothetical protein